MQGLLGIHAIPFRRGIYFVSLQFNLFSIMSFRSGFVNIIGKPNVGKSTLMNGLVGERLSIINAKAQTTRHRIMGIVNGEDFQIVYSDTPGIIEKPAYKLQESMMGFVKTAFTDADIFLYVVEINEKKPDEKLVEKLNKFNIPILLLLNKIDLSNQDELMEKGKFWKELIPKAEIIPVSALHKFNLDLVMDRIRFHLPEGPAYFPQDELSDKPMRFFCAEIIREKILSFYDKEIPYSCEVVIESYKEEENIIKIRAIIYVARETQKGILIGHQGTMLKKTGTAARKDMEELLHKKVFLETYVKVEKDWRDSDNHLKRFGYNQT